MSSMESIWDEPIEPSNTRPTPSHLIDVTSIDGEVVESSGPQSIQRKQALFLPDSDDENLPPSIHDTSKKSSRYTKPNASTSTPNIDSILDPELEALFNEGEDDPFNFAPAAKHLDTAALDKEALERHKKDGASIPALISNITPSSHQESNDASTTPAQAQAKGDEEPKEKRAIARLDEGRLLGPSGFAKLIQYTRDFKIKGKGHEESDLNRLLQIYQFWTHEMYPKTNFKDTVTRVERLCHSRRMNVALSVWRDEALGIPAGAQEFDSSDAEGEDAMGVDPGTLNAGESVHSEAEDIPSSRPSSVPPSSDMEDRAINAILEEEERRRIGGQSRDLNSSAGDPKSSTSHNPKTTERIDMDVDDDEVWNIINSMDQDPGQGKKHPPVQSKKVFRSGDLSDEDMWDLVSAPREPARNDMVTPKPSPSTASGRVDFDDPNCEDLYV